MVDKIPLVSLFGKSEACSVKVSPGGRWMGWLGRANGALNIWIAPLPLPEHTDGNEQDHTSKSIPGAVQLTCSSDRDVCTYYTFTHDDKRIIYLQETSHGSELYHPFLLDLPQNSCDSSTFPVASGVDLLRKYPELTCAIGFVGGLQLWLPHANNDVVILATGRGSLFWDLCELNLTSHELLVLRRNPINSVFGIVCVVMTLLKHIAIVCLSFMLRVLTSEYICMEVNKIASAPSFPLQYFIHPISGDIIGHAECCISVDGISLQFTHRSDRSRSNPDVYISTCHAIPLKNLNMQLVGSGGATGTLYMEETDDGGVIVHTCAVTDTTSLIKYPGEEVVFHDARADISQFLIHPRSGKVDACYVISERTDIVPISESGKAVCKSLALFSSHTKSTQESVSLVSRSHEDDIWVVLVASDRNAGLYYLVQNPLSRKVDECTAPSNSLCSIRCLFSSRPVLLTFPLVDTQSVVIPSRDGLSLPGYLTFPCGTKAESVCIPQPTALHLPLVIVLHGGPSARDYDGYNPAVQLLTSRGMAVLSVNYRGSTGYGMNYMKLGNGNVDKMHDDVEDARIWAISNRIADPDRIAILGASWGGYLALGGVTGISSSTEASPNSRYAAVVAIVPLVSVGAANTSKSFRGDPLVARYWKQIYGPVIATSVKEAKTLSPLFQMHKLTCNNVLLIHGENDPRVPQQQVDAIANAALERGANIIYMTYSNEGHSIRKEPNVIHMWHSIERFLCECLKLTAPPEVNDADTKNHTASLKV